MNTMQQTPVCPRWLLVSILALAPLTAAVPAPAAAEAKGVGQGVGMITTYAGQVRVSRAVKPGQAVTVTLVPVKVGQAIFTNDVIETQAKSRAQILFQDDSILNVAEKTRLEITEAMYDPVQGSRQSVLKLQEGKVRAIISKFLTGGQSKFEIHTPTTVAAARGTELFVHHFVPLVITEPPRTILVLINGSLLAQSMALGQVVGAVMMTPGTRVEVQPGMPPPPPIPVPPNELRQLLRDTTIVRAEAKEEAEKKAAEATAKAEEAKKKAEEAKAKAEEAKKKETEAKAKEEEAKKKEDAAKTKEEDAKAKADKAKEDVAKAEGEAKAKTEAEMKVKAEAQKAEAEHARAKAEAERIGGEGEAGAKAKAEVEAKAALVQAKMAQAQAMAGEAEAARGQLETERTRAAEAETFHAAMKQDMVAVQQEVITFRQDVVLAQTEFQQVGQFMAAAIMDAFVATFQAEMLGGGASLGEVALPGDRPMMPPPGMMPPGMTPPPGMLPGDMMPGMLPGAFDYTTGLQTVTDTFTTFNTNITNQLVNITQTTTVPITGTTGTTVEFRFPQPSNVEVIATFP